MSNIHNFMEACIEQNSIEELIDALYRRSADKGDCKEWEITPSEWRDAIQAALKEKVIELRAKSEVKI